MRIFNAYSIHPDLYQKLEDHPQVEYLVIRENSRKRGSKVRDLKLTVSDLQEMMAGNIRDQEGRKLVWEATFSGGKTVYIRVDAFNKEYRRYLSQPKLL